MSTQLVLVPTFDPVTQEARTQDMYVRISQMISYPVHVIANDLLHCQCGPCMERDVNACDLKCTV